VHTRSWTRPSFTHFRNCRWQLMRCEEVVRLMCRVGCDVMFRRYVPTFRRNALSPSSGWRMQLYLIDNISHYRTFHVSDFLAVISQCSSWARCTYMQCARGRHRTLCTNRNTRLGENRLSSREIVCYVIGLQVVNTDGWELHTYIVTSGLARFSCSK
jgi:hypothetical protein